MGNETPITTTSVTIPPARVVFDDDMDGRSSDWTGDWTRTFKEGRGRVWTDSRGQYDNDERKELRSPLINLRRVRDARVTFEASYELENRRDFVTVQARRPGGDWQSLGQFTGFSGWDRHQLDLSHFDGGSVQLRFLLETDHSVQRDGFYLDRLVVSGRLG